MFQPQISFAFSPYTALYDLVVPKDNMLRQINELVNSRIQRLAIIRNPQERSCKTEPANGEKRFTPWTNRSKRSFPPKIQSLEAEIAYCQQLIEVTQTQLGIAQVPKITEPLLLQETVEDDVEQLRISEDQDARVGQ